ncbi:MAG TPA: AraC family transcriptional regulator ligand-binding domain-containing protein, partial [Reyranella sp.]|nr:AraC family transcriptional regulator ligand-binding domain-containing protein [Reyranella sp.]
MSKRTTAAIWVKGILDMLAAERLDVPALLAAAGIDAAGLDAPGARLSTDKISLLWQLAAER